MYHPRVALQRALPLVLVALGAAPALGQSFRPTLQPSGQPVYARVTITNPTDITIVFQAEWPGEEARREILEPGQSVRLQTTFRRFTPNPELTVTYRNGPWYRRPEVVTLPSGHVRPGTNNPGRIYDFDRQRSNIGPLLVLKPR